MMTDLSMSTAYILQELIHQAPVLSAPTLVVHLVGHQVLAVVRLRPAHLRHILIQLSLQLAVLSQDPISATVL